MVSLEMRAIHSLLALIPALVWPVLSAAQEETPAADERIRHLMAEAEVPGLSAAVVEGGKITWSGAFGVTKAAGGTPVTEATVFEAASLTKPVVAHAALQLVEAGKLDLDRPLVAYLGVNIEPDVKEDARFPKITARHVLSHSTGFPNWRRRNPLTIAFEPGSEFSYSGEGFVLLGKAMEKLSGLSLEDLVQQRVFQPLKMRSSSLVWRSVYDRSAASGHDEFSETQEKFRPEKANAAASLHTTARDFARFLGEMLQPTRLKAETVKAMLTPQVTVEPTRPEPPDQPLHWGLGWGLEGNAAPHAFWHWGDNGSFRCLTLGAPVTDGPGRAFVYFTNSFNGLAVAAAMTEVLLGEGTSYALTGWIGYDAYDSPIFRLRRDFLNTAIAGGGPAVERFTARVRKELGDEVLEERAVNNLGYTLLGKDNDNAREAALVLFHLNVDLYPDSWNVYDSLAEGYYRTGNEERAVHFYRESLRRNPDNDNGKQMLERIREEQAETVEGEARNKSEG